MSPYVIAAAARRDLAGIDDFSARRWDDEQARRYIASIYSAFGRLAVQPRLGRRQPYLPSDVRLYKVGRHFIVYRVASAERIDILNVLHEAMDLAARTSRLRR